MEIWIIEILLYDGFEVVVHIMKLHFTNKCSVKSYLTTIYVAI